MMQCNKDVFILSWLAMAYQLKYYLHMRIYASLKNPEYSMYEITRVIDRFVIISVFDKKNCNVDVIVGF
jgi:hypothetical protein